MSSKRTRRAPAPEVQVTVRGGEVPVDSRDYAADKIGHVADYSTRPVLYAHVVLEVVGDPAPDASRTGRGDAGRERRAAARPRRGGRHP